MRLSRHPSRAELGRWLAGDDVDAQVDTHLATCDRCAAVMEELETATGSRLAQTLADALAPPADLTERLEQRVVARLDAREVLGVVADLFGAGVETSRLLLSETPTHDDD